MTKDHNLKQKVNAASEKGSFPNSVKNRETGEEGRS